jgi:MFS-type transporter involved in bile tolerance (Atg22 family)
MYNDLSWKMYQVVSGGFAVIVAILFIGLVVTAVIGIAGAISSSRIIRYHKGMKYQCVPEPYVAQHPVVRDALAALNELAMRQEDSRRIPAETLAAHSQYIGPAVRETNRVILDSLARLNAGLEHHLEDTDQ